MLLCTLYSHALLHRAEEATTGLFQEGTYTTGPFCSSRRRQPTALHLQYNSKNRNDDNDNNNVNDDNDTTTTTNNNNNDNNTNHNASNDMNNNDN